MWLLNRGLNVFPFQYNPWSWEIIKRSSTYRFFTSLGSYWWQLPFNQRTNRLWYKHMQTKWKLLSMLHVLSERQLLQSTHNSIKKISWIHWLIVHVPVLKLGVPSLHFVYNVNKYVHKTMSMPTFETVFKSCLFQGVHVLGVQCQKKNMASKKKKWGRSVTRESERMPVGKQKVLLPTYKLPTGACNLTAGLWFSLVSRCQNAKQSLDLQCM